MLKTSPWRQLSLEFIKTPEFFSEAILPKCKQFRSLDPCHPLRKTLLFRLLSISARTMTPKIHFSVFCSKTLTFLPKSGSGFFAQIRKVVGKSKTVLGKYKQEPCRSEPCRREPCQRESCQRELARESLPERACQREPARGGREL